MTPSTRGRTSTRLIDSTSPTNSYSSGRVRGSTVTTPTSAGGGAGGVASPLLHAAATIASIAIFSLWGITVLLLEGRGRRGRGRRRGHSTTLQGKGPATR